MDDIIERLKNISIIQNMLSESNGKDFIEKNSENIKGINLLIDKLELDIDSYKISTEQINQYNQEQEDYEVILDILFPIYFAIWCKFR